MRIGVISSGSTKANLQAASQNDPKYYVKEYIPSVMASDTTEYFNKENKMDIKHCMDIKHLLEHFVTVRTFVVCKYCMFVLLK